MRAVLVAVALLTAVFLTARPALRAFETLTTGSPCSGALPVPSELRLPAVVPPGEPVGVEKSLLGYLSAYKYRDLGWCVDKGVRDTGPYVDRVMYGTHPAVRIYYSPEMVEWLRSGRKGAPRDGAVIIKEQYGDKPAAYFQHFAPQDLKPTDWTIMIRRSSASHDGWFWAEVFVGMFNKPASQTAYPWAGFGLYCLRCHASAANALTFASLENVQGFPGEPLRYYVDNSWRTSPVHAEAHAPSVEPVPSAVPTPLAVQTFPPEPLDTYVAHAHMPHMFITSDQCEGCHGAASGKPFGPSMWVTPAPGHGKNGLNVSEYGEWRWSPMALAGRDPVFYSQLENEMAYLRTIHHKAVSDALQHKVTNTCETCHGVMGKRTFSMDHPTGTFEPSIVFDANPSSPTFHYGGLARDGISCAVCHHIAESKTPPGQTPLAFFLNNKINGNFDLSPADQLFGPFKNDEIVTHPMNESLGAKPHYNTYTQSSRMCGSCHTINLPVVDKPPVTSNPVAHNVEQATYLEWLNSKFQTEYNPLPGARSCQDCHMPEGITDPSRGVAIAHIASRIALVEDTTYPATTDAAAAKDLDVRYRTTGFRRHELLGLNAFLLSMFKQHPEVLGVRTDDYMSGSTTDLADAIAHVVQQAREQSAQVHVRTHVSGHTLTADVEVVNLTGHRFPSGVGFRRAFLNIVVHDGASPDAAPVFVSGNTDGHGRILGANGLPLPSESFARGRDGRQSYQEHFDEAHPITSPDQVQVFEELVRDDAGNFTTSFIRRDHEVKDNRILPTGWTPTGPTPTIPKYFLEATYPHGRAANDPRYRDGLGHAVVRYVITLPPNVDPSRVRVEATLYYQSWAPYFVTERSTGSGPAAVRFAALAQSLNLENTQLANWKIRVAGSSSISVMARRAP